MSDPTPRHLSLGDIREILSRYPDEARVLSVTAIPYPAEGQTVRTAEVRYALDASDVTRVDVFVRLFGRWACDPTVSR